RIAGELGVSETRRRYIPNGVDVELFRPADTAAVRARLGLPAAAAIYMCVGYFLPVQGHAELGKAVARLLATRPRAGLRLAARAWASRESVTREAADAGLGRLRRVLGAIDHRTTVTRLEASDGLVLPSFNEGTPLVTLEALACGKPVVATAVGGTTEVVSGERFGLLVPPGDDEALAHAMDEARRRAWDVATLRARAADYSWPCIVDQICDLYADISAAELAARFRAKTVLSS